MLVFSSLAYVAYCHDTWEGVHWKPDGQEKQATTLNVAPENRHVPLVSVCLQLWGAVPASSHSCSNFRCNPHTGKSGEKREREREEKESSNHEGTLFFGDGAV